jgi:DNA-binding response OmpR family regulator
VTNYRAYDSDRQRSASLRNDSFKALVSEANANFIQKPFMPAALAAKVREVLDRQG